MDKAEMKTYIVNQKKDYGEILLYGGIGQWEENTSKSFCTDLSKLDAVYNLIKIRVNCTGGDCLMGLAIFNAIRNCKAETHAYIDGCAASMGSIICLAANKVYMSKYALLMIHPPSGSAFGSFDKLHEIADLIEEIQSTLAEIYSAKTGKSVEEINNSWLSKGNETWFNAQEALAAHLIDGIFDGIKISAPEKLAAKAGLELSENFATIYNKQKRMENLQEFISFFSLAENAGTQEIMGAIQNQSNEILNLKNQIQILTQENDNYKAQLEVENQNKITALVDSAIAAKKITESQRGIYTSLASSNFEATKGALEAIKAYVPISTQLLNSNVQNTSEMTFEDYRKKNPQALLAMKKNDFESYSKLYQAQYGAQPKN